MCSSAVYAYLFFCCSCRKAGLGTGLTLQGSIHPELAQSGELVRFPSLVPHDSFILRDFCLKMSLHAPRFSVLQTVKAIEQFGAVTEDMLIKHGKKIIGESVCMLIEDTDTDRSICSVGSFITWFWSLWKMSAQPTVSCFRWTVCPEESCRQCHWPVRHGGRPLQVHWSYCAHFLLSMKDLCVHFNSLCRASRSLTEGNASAQHEKMLCEIWCKEVRSQSCRRRGNCWSSTLKCNCHGVSCAVVALQAHERIMRDLQALHASESRQLFKNLRAISAAVVDNGGVVSTHPLGF